MILLYAEHSVSVRTLSLTMKYSWGYMTERFSSFGVFEVIYNTDNLIAYLRISITV